MDSGIGRLVKVFTFCVLRFAFGFFSFLFEALVEKATKKLSLVSLSSLSLSLLFLTLSSWNLTKSGTVASPEGLGPPEEAMAETSSPSSRPPRPASAPSAFTNSSKRSLLEAGLPLEAQARANARSTSAGVSLHFPEEMDSRSPAARTSLEKRAPSISAAVGDGSGKAGIVVPEGALEEPEGRRAPKAE